MLFRERGGEKEHTSVRTLRLVGRGVVMIANSATVVDAVARRARMRVLEYIFLFDVFFCFAWIWVVFYT